MQLRASIMEMLMCALCEGAKTLTDELPCSVQLEKYGRFLQQVMGEGPATDMAFRATGGIPSISEQAREVQGSLLYGIHRGRVEDIKREGKRRWRDRFYAIGLTVFGAVLGVVIGWGIAPLFPDSPLG